MRWWDLPTNIGIVILSAAKNPACLGLRFFAALRMTVLDLIVNLPRRILTTDLSASSRGDVIQCEKCSAGKPAKSQAI
jgi:hypothetical protein